MPLWKKLLFSIVVVVGIFAIAEIAVRLLAQPLDVTIRLEHQEIIRVLGLSTLNDTMEFEPYLFWRLKDGLRDFRVTGRIGERAVDFTLNTRGGLRVTPPPSGGSSGAGKVRVLTLGDSCTFGLGINDEETWPARLQEVLLRDGLDAEVINAGVPGYTAFQGRRFLERHGLELRPDVVVATFGFNDDASWGSSSDPETAHDLSIRWWEPMLGHSRAYLALRRLLRSAGPTAATGPQSGGPPSDGAGKGRARLSAEEFRHELLEIKRLCDRHGIELVLMIWPYEAQVSQNLPRLVRHQTVTAAVCQEEQVPCVNLIEAFIGAERPMFLDHVHANPDGSRVAADAVLSAVRSLGRISSERP